MASYTISSAVTTAGNAQTINTGDTVTVTSSGSLYGTGTTGVGIYSSNSGGASGGFDTLNISGSVRGGEYGIWDSGSGGNDVITVNSGGSIFGGAFSAGTGAAIYIQGGSNTITNDGLITNGLTGYGIQITGDGNTITNNGTISSTNGGGYSAIDITGGSNTVTNNGKIFVADDSGIDLDGTAGHEGHNVVTNGGTITSYETGIWANGGFNTVTNSGTIVATTEAGIVVEGGNNSVTNTGSIVGTYAGVDMTGGSNTLTNSGTIASTNDEYGVELGGAGNVLINKSGGAITGASTGVSATGASLVIKNSGSIQGVDYGIDATNATGAHIKVLGGGSVLGGTTGIIATGDGLHVTVNGSVSGGEYGVGITGDSAVVKVGAHGVITGGTGSGLYCEETGNTAHIFNAGTIQGEYGIDLFKEGSGHIHNTGTIIGNSASAIYISDGSDHVTNQGTISGVNCALYVVSGTGNVVTNQAGGIMKAYVTGGTANDATLYFSNGVNTVTNSGKMSFALHGATNDAVIYSGGGSNVITNNAGGVLTDFHGGVTAAYAIELKGSSNSVTNDGKIVGTVQIGATGTNTYDGAGGHLKGTVMGGTGVDTIILGAGHSSAEGNGGADSITVGSGSDNLVYTAATDSNVNFFDAVDGFVAGTDHFTFVTGNAFSGLDSVTVNSLSAVTDTALQAATAGHLDANGAVALSVSTGLYAGDVFLLVDADGNAGFDSAGNGTDYLIVLTHLSGTLTASDIIMT